jgi:hypothetical protein
MVSALLLGLPAAAAAQTLNDIPADNTPYGTTSGEFLLLGAGARGTALGNAYQAIAADVSALYYNPAGAALITRPGAEVGTYSYVAGTKYTWGGLALPMAGGVRTFGLQIGTFGFNNQPVYTVDQPDGTGSVYSVSESFVGATLAQNFSDRFSAGLTAKFISDHLGDASGTAFAVDFGTNFHATLNGRPVKLGFTVSNLGTGLSYTGGPLNTVSVRQPPAGQDQVPNQPQPAELRTKAFPLPSIFRVALAYDAVSAANSRFTVLGEFNQPNNNKAGFSVGGEYAMAKIGNSPFGVAVRGSYSYASANTLKPTVLKTALNDESALQGLAGGGGLTYTSGNFNVGFDYAFKYMGALGATNYFSFSLGW